MAAAASVLGMVWIFGGEPTPPAGSPEAPVVVVENHAPLAPLPDEMAPIADEAVGGPVGADLTAADATPAHPRLRRVEPGGSRLLEEGGTAVEHRHQPGAWPWQPARYVVSPPVGVDRHIR
jgi:hypothetical protein